jgi:hypothetical protein
MAKRILSVTLGLIAVVAVALTSPFVEHVIRFESHQSEIAQLIDHAAPGEQALPTSVHELLLFSLGRRTASYAALLLLGQFDDEPHRGMMGWHVKYATWSWLVALHFTERERLTVIAHLTYTGDGRYGLDNTAHSLFGHSLADASPTEAVTLVMLSRSPSLHNDPDRLTVERDRFLSRFKRRTGL